MKISKKSILICGLICSFTNVTAQKYKVSDIPKDMLANAKAVIRNSETEFEIKDTKTAIAKHTLAITILNDNGLPNSVLSQFYNKFMTVKSIKWTLYDQNGNQLKNSSNIKVEDYSAISGYSLYEDTRVKYVDPKNRIFPFTVEYSFEILYDGFLNYPTWKVYDGYNISVQHSKFRIVTPNGFKFRYLQKNYSDSCSVTSTGEKTIYTWEAANQAAIIPEPYAYPYQTYTPVVYFAPNEFEIGGYKGNCETWNSFGKWIDDLDKGRDVLNLETVEKIQNLISDAKTDYEKVNILYKFMQQKVRYVSTQIGIGGMQTIEAEKVDRLSYGDCKALSNYMKALLNIAGIKSFYTLVSAGTDSPSILDDFPSNQFNHAMLCIPFPKDTIWLECTNQHIPPGYIGKFTDSRNVLLTSEEGGVLVRTKEYTINDNIQSRITTVELKSDGNADALIRTCYKGLLYDDVYGILLMDNEARKLFLQKRITIPSYNISGFNYKEDSRIVPSIDEELSLSLHNYGTITEGKMLFNPNLITRFKNIPQKNSERRSNIKISRSYCESDTTIIKLPSDYRVSQVPARKIISAEFGEYFTDLVFDDKQIRYVRSFKFYKGDFPVDKYSDFLNFCEKISSSDNNYVVLVKDDQ